MKQNASSRKLNQQARDVIANALLFEVSDPRLRFVTITGCEVSFDRSACNVYYTCNADDYDEVAQAFMSARGLIRSLMAKKLPWRVAPELRFILDSSVDNAERIERALMREAKRSGDDAGK